jgi:hypothetical protein
MEPMNNFSMQAVAVPTGHAILKKKNIFRFLLQRLGKVLDLLGVGWTL